MRNTEDLRLYACSHSFPTPEQPQIARDNILATIEEILSGQTDFVVIEGEEGMGKTSLLAQFALKNPKNGLSLFIRSASRWSYDPRMIRYDLCNQINWILRNEELRNLDDASDAFLRKGFFALQRRASLQRNIFFLVVDGIDELPEEEWQTRNSILDILPIGLQGFRCLLSGSLDQISSGISKRAKGKSFPLPGFTLEEAGRFLSDLELANSESAELHKVCRGVPGHLASAKRIIKSGYSVSELLSDIPSKLANLLEMEWRKVNQADGIQLMLLAIVAYEKKPRRVEDLASIVGMPVEEVAGRLSDLSFIESAQDGNVAYVSEAFRKFACQRLHLYKMQAHETVIDYLLRDPLGRDAIENLPDHLEQAGRLEDLISYLSTDNIVTTLEQTQSVSLVKQRTALGLRAASTLRRDGDLMRFALHQSGIADLGDLDVSRSEVEARMALNDHESALALANAVTLKEQRLHMLCIIARLKKKMGLTPEPELVDQVSQLLSQIEPSELGDVALEIASDMFFVSADLAVEMIERATKSSTSDSALDWALASVSVAAASTGSKPANTLSLRIQDPRAKHLASSFALHLGEYNARDVIAEVQTITRTWDQIGLLRSWLARNRRKPDSLDVVCYCLQLLVSDGSVSPNAGIFKDLAEPLCYAQDLGRVEELAKLLVSYRESARRLGPTEEYYKFEMFLLQAESRYNVGTTLDRILTLYLEVNSLAELYLRVTLYAQLMVVAYQINAVQALPGLVELHDMVGQDFDASLKSLLESSADHYLTTKEIVKIFAGQLPELGLRTALALNLERRRDRALFDLVSTLCSPEVEQFNLTLCVRTLKMISDPHLKEIAVVALLDRVAEDEYDILADSTNVGMIMQILATVENPTTRCQSHCLAFSAAVRAGLSPDVRAHLLSELKGAWSSGCMGDDSFKIEIGYRITQSLASASIETAREYLQQADEARQEGLLSSLSAGETFFDLVELALRLFSGLLASRLASDEDSERLGSLIDRLPSASERVLLWGDLALRFFLNSRIEDCRRIVSQKVRNLLGFEDTWERRRLVVSVSPALFVAHRATAIEELQRLPLGDREMALMRISKVLTNRLPADEPLESRGMLEIGINYEEAVDLCDLAALAQTDGVIDGFVESICRGIAVKHGRTKLTNEQRTDVLRRLEQIVDAKLPDVNNIRHDGYKLNARALMLRARRAPLESWQPILAAATAIPNSADRALILGTIVESLSDRSGSKAKELLGEAAEIVQSLPSPIDRAARSVYLAQVAREVSPEFARRILRSAMQSTLVGRGPDFVEARREIIDTAHQIDPNLAITLIELVDDDPGRASIRRELDERERFHGVLKKCSGSTGDGLSDEEEGYLPEVAWKLLGRLNAGRVSALPIARVRDLMAGSNRWSLRRSSWVFAWLAQNVITKYSGTPEAKAFIRPLFEATILGTELAERVAFRSAKQASRIRDSYSAAGMPGLGESVLIRAGSRETAMGYLLDWLRENVRSFLKVCDPYFGPSDLELLKMVSGTAGGCKVSILTSRRHQDQERVTLPWEDAFRARWRSISDEEPPETEVVIVGTSRTGQLPIHDRWWVADKGGLRMGTSFSALGRTRDSEVAPLSIEELSEREQEIDLYLGRRRREHQGDKLSYLFFDL